MSNLRLINIVSLKAKLGIGGKPTYTPERRQCGGFRPFKRSGLNSRFVP